MGLRKLFWLAACFFTLVCALPSGGFCQADPAGDTGVETGDLGGPGLDGGGVLPEPEPGPQPGQTCGLWFLAELKKDNLPGIIARIRVLLSGFFELRPAPRLCSVASKRRSR